MISRKKLEELIEKGGKVWVSHDSVVQCIDLNQLCGVRNDMFFTCEMLCGLSCLYLTREEAEFALEFKDIKRTETLNLPSWEELDQQWNGYNFTDKDGLYYSLVVDYGFNKNIHILGENLDYSFYTKDITKENYIDACKVAKKLFLGEDLGDGKAD